MAKKVKIYSLIQDNEDGTAKVVFLKDKDLVERLVFEPKFNLNEGAYETYIFPEDLDLAKCGIFLSDEDYLDEDH